MTDPEAALIVASHTNSVCVPCRNVWGQRTDLWPICPSTAAPKVLKQVL